MDWVNERWVKVYTRDTADVIAIGPEGRAVWWELIRKVDSAGVLDLPDGDLAILADICRVPVAWMEIAMPKILARRMVVIQDHKLIIPNTVPAQEARQSDPLRQRESRARRRAKALAPQLDLPATDTPPATGDRDVADPMSQNVTPPSRPVTIRGDQTRSDQIPDLAHLPVSDLELEEVYRRYPRKQGKAAGLRAAKTKIRDRADFELLCAAIDRMQAAWATAGDLEFCPHFSSFIRGERWRDETLPLPSKQDRWTRPANTGHSPAATRERFEGADEDDIGDLGAGIGATS